MKRLSEAATRPRLHVWIAGVSLLVWLALSPITMTTSLRASLAWITAASLFANVATCFGWWVSAVVNVRAERIDDRSAEHATLAHIEESEERIRADLHTLLERSLSVKTPDALAIGGEVAAQLAHYRDEFLAELQKGLRARPLP